MSSFQLDDVRDTFAVDMGVIIDGIEECSRTLLNAQALSLSIPHAEGGTSLLEMISRHAHAVFGSTSLLSVDSMSACARELEQLSQTGADALAKLEAQLKEVRRIARLSHDSAQDLRAMLTLELDGRQGEALKLSENLVARLTAPPSAEQAAPAPQHPGALPQEFSFDDESQVSETGPSSVMVKDELLSAFQQEARELQVGLQGHLQALAVQPNDLRAAAQLERIYHTLKGAAGTVGLTDVGMIAAGLQTEFEHVVEGGAEVTPVRLGNIFRQTNRLLRASHLPEISLDLLRTADATGTGDRTRSFFVEEVSGIVRDATSLTEQLSSANQTEQGELSKQLGQLFHRLKGSALVLGDQKVADQAMSLQQSIGNNLSVAALKQGLNTLRELISHEAASSAPASMMEGSSTAAAASEQRVHKEKVSVDVNQERELWEAFLQECQELLEAADKEIFSLETTAHPKTALQTLMRHVHTLKGAVNAVGLSPTGKMLHQVEDFLEQLAEAPILPSMKNLTSFFLDVQQEVRANLKEAPKGWVISSQESIEIAAKEVMAGGRATRPPSTGTSRGSGSSTPKSSTQAGTGDEGDRRLIRVSTDRLDELMNLAGELVVSRSRLLTRVGTLKSLQTDLGRSRKSLFGRVDEFRQQYEFSGLRGDTKRSRRAQALAPNGHHGTNGGTNGATARQHSRGQGAVALGVTESVEATTTTQDFSDFSALELDRYEDINILARSLAEIADDLTEMDGQLTRELTQIAEDSESFSFLISRIQSEVTQARMISAESLFARLRLPIRDAAEREHKEVQVHFEQGSVNMDKTIIDALFKPMLHLVRNAVHHGIEAPEQREKAGKSRVGNLTLRAHQESGQIVVELRDDGKGLNLKHLKERGVAMGLVGADEPLDSPLIKRLVFATGVSTEGEVGDVAGRGVGGDVVRRAVERLNGEIQVETTAGQGTTFSITLPMTLVITQSLLVRSSGQLYAIPLFFAERIIELENEALSYALGLAQLKVDDRYISVRRLEQVFGQSTEPRVGPVVVVRIGDRRLAIQIDSLVAREEVVVKNLGELLKGHPLFAGVTVRGNGELVLIVDVPGLMERSGVLTGVTSQTEMHKAKPGSVVEVESYEKSDVGPPSSDLAASPSSASSGAAPSTPEPQLSELPSDYEASSPDASQGQPPSSLVPAQPPKEAVAPMVAKKAPGAEAKTPVEARPTAPEVKAPAEAKPAVEAKAPAARPTPPAHAKPADAKKPAPAPPAPKPPTPAQAAVPAKAQAPAVPRVLFVDDSLSVRKVAEKALTESGVDVTVAVDGADALEKLRKSDFDLVFTDLEMPRVHGYELIREVRFLPRYQTLPVVVVSSRSGAKHQDQARQLGATDYLTKPFTAQMLEDVLTKYLNFVPNRLRKP